MTVAATESLATLLRRIATNNVGGSDRDLPRRASHIVIEAADRLDELSAALSKGNALELTARTAETLDAERYRYLRDRSNISADGPCVCTGLGDLFEFLHGADVDEAVDEALAEEKAK
jgi:hypothetical protein